MRKLTLSEKKQTQGGASSLMGIATGILTFTSISNLIIDLINRYWKRTPPENIINKSHENCFTYENPECFLSPQIDLQRNILNNWPKNRITLF
ncbi:hypothetical protein [Mycoplasma parvum]|uniref:Uncharacterized protein n=1 Tax=Mycoplasma parvum str. Indiana TaxID=1403316 RepID=U5NFA1_9MOLU|nr:hypothetical protein [Mycoplasma parvum]AGX88883.1 hypothetical protein PRV_00570 [Mycoplasma parvum str. Indiana]